MRGHVRVRADLQVHRYVHVHACAVASMTVRLRVGTPDGGMPLLAFYVFVFVGVCVRILLSLIRLRTVSFYSFEMPMETRYYAACVQILSDDSIILTAVYSQRKEIHREICHSVTGSVSHVFFAM